MTTHCPPGPRTAPWNPRPSPIGPTWATFFSEADTRTCWRAARTGRVAAGARMVCILAGVLLSLTEVAQWRRFQGFDRTGLA